MPRWQHIQSMAQHYWKRWQKEYLAELQTRTKWRKRYEEIVKLVLQWQLGRVIELHRGSDDIVRVVTIKVQSGTVKRAFNRICVLPVDIGITKYSQSLL